MIAPLDEDGTYIVGGGFGFLEGQFAGDVPQDVFDQPAREGPALPRPGLHAPLPHLLALRLRARLPPGRRVVHLHGWRDRAAGRRCATRSMDVTRKARWIPEFGLARELDWLRNMHDWMISKKRYYGLALPIYECKACGNFEVIGSEAELQAARRRGLGGVRGPQPAPALGRRGQDRLRQLRRAGRAHQGRRQPLARRRHRPLLDAQLPPRPGLLGAVVPGRLGHRELPGPVPQLVLRPARHEHGHGARHADEGTPPFPALFSYALLRDENGEEMHKSQGQRHLVRGRRRAHGRRRHALALPARQPGEQPQLRLRPRRRAQARLPLDAVEHLLLLRHLRQHRRLDASGRAIGQSGNRASRAWRPCPEVSKDERLPAGSKPSSPSSTAGRSPSSTSSSPTCTDALENYDSMTACRQIEEFVEALSNWYVRRSRRRFWKVGDDADKHAAYETLWTCLATVNRLMAPMMPFLAEEHVPEPRARRRCRPRPESVHLCDWPQADEALIDARALERRARSCSASSRWAAPRAPRRTSRCASRSPPSTCKLQNAGRSRDRAPARRPDHRGAERQGAATSSSDDSDFFDYQVRPNLPVLGPKYGSEVGRIQRALAAADKAAARPRGRRRPPRRRSTASSCSRTSCWSRIVRQARLRRRRGGRLRRRRHHRDHAGAGGRRPGARAGAPHPGDAQERRLRHRRPHPPRTTRATPTSRASSSAWRDYIAQETLADAISRRRRRRPRRGARTSTAARSR